MKTVFQIGPDKNLKGGIATVIKQIDESKDLNNKYNIKTIPTISDSRLITYLKSIVTVFKVKDESIVHFHVASNGSFLRKYILFKILRKNTKKIIHIHGGGFVDYYKNSMGLIRCCINDMLENSCKIISVSDYMINELENEFMQCKDKFIKIYNGIELNELDIDYNEKNNTVVYLGRLAEYKGVYDLINAIEYIKESIKDNGWKIIIAGDGEVDLVNETINKKEIDHIVKAIGWTCGEEKIKLLKESKVLMIPSHVESFGISAIEAMNYGNAVIATNVGALPEIIKDKKNGFIVKKGNYVEMGKNIKKMIDGNSTIKKMCYENIEYSKLFSKDTMIKNIIELYDNL